MRFRKCEGFDDTLGFILLEKKGVLPLSEAISYTFQVSEEELLKHLESLKRHAQA